MANHESRQPEPSIEEAQALEDVVALDPKLWAVHEVEHYGNIEMWIELQASSDKCLFNFRFVLNALSGEVRDVDLVAIGLPDDGDLEPGYFSGPEVETALIVVRDRYREAAGGDEIGDLKMPAKD